MRKMPKRVITFKADDEFIEKMHRAMKVLGLNRSELIRTAVLKVVNSLEGDNRTTVCLELSSEELIYLKLISNDPIVAIKHLIRHAMSEPIDTLVRG